MKPSLCCRRTPRSVAAYQKRMSMLNPQMNSARRQVADMLAEARSKTRSETALSGERKAILSPGGKSDQQELKGGLPVACASSLPSAHEAGCFGLAFNRAGTMLASCGADKTVKLWDTLSGTLSSGPSLTLHVRCYTPMRSSPILVSEWE